MMVLYLIIPLLEPISPTLEVNHPLCFGENGSILIQGSGGSGGFNYSVLTLIFLIILLKLMFFFF